MHWTVEAAHPSSRLEEINTVPNLGLFAEGRRGYTSQLKSPKPQATDKPQRTLVSSVSGDQLSVSHKLGGDGKGDVRWSPAALHF